MKILYVTTISSTLKAFLLPHIKFLVDCGNNVDVACNDDGTLNKIVMKMRCKLYNIPFKRNPIKKENIIAYKKLKKLIIDEKYDIVHTHTPVASAIVRLACKNIKNVRIIYTAHGFHFYKGAPFINWLIYYPIEKYLSRYTDVLITMNKEDYNISKNKFFTKKIEYIPGVGLDIEKFKEINIDKKEKRKELGVPEDCFLILSVGELSKRKNHEVVIKAISQLNIPNVHYAICGSGKLRDYLLNIAIDLGIENKIHFLGYRKDVIEIYKVSDLLVLSSLHEGLPVNLMEAMALEIPIICSRIRGNIDLIDEEKGGYFSDVFNIESYTKNINCLFNISKEDKELMIKYNKKKLEKYYLNNILEKIKTIYSELY